MLISLRNWALVNTAKFTKPQTLKIMRLSLLRSLKKNYVLANLFLVIGDEYGKNALIREIEIMKNLKSPNIIQFVDIQETSNNIYIFQ